MLRPNKLAIVVPCYNEEETLQKTIDALSVLLDELISKDKVAQNSRLLLVNDGSKDNTWNIIKENHRINIYVNGLKLAHNVGHQSALYAGLEVAKNDFDITISIDADLQDDISIIEKMIDLYHQGDEVVYGVRNDRTTDSFFKKTTAQTFYKIISSCSVETIYNHADFRLMSKLAVESLSQYQETNLYLRGIVPKIGYNSSTVEYKRKEREAGESKYNIYSMLKLALDGITSFSNTPLDIIFKIGLFTSFASIIAIIVNIILNINHILSGVNSYILISIWLVCGIQLCALGIIGQYIGRINQEVKHRPRYIVENYLQN